MPEIDVIKVDATGQALTDLEGHVHDRLTTIKAGLADLHTTQLVKWRKMYKAEPAEETRSMPFENASNLVVPLVPIHADTLKARLLASIFRIRPIWTLALAGDWEGKAEDIRKDTEEFLSTEAIEVDSLDLYRVYNESVDDVIQYGSMFVKTPWEEIVNDRVISMAGDGTGKYEYVPEVDYSGPRPEKIQFDDFFMSPAEKTIERADFKAHRRRLYKHELMERKFRKQFDADAVESILGTYDRTGPTTADADQQRDGAKQPNGPGSAQWDVYECWFYYRLDGHRVKITAWYHLLSRKFLRVQFTYLPDDPYVAGRLLTRDGSFYGRGMCEYLATFQEEVSQIHNQRRDAQTVANTKVWRVDPFSKLHQGYKIFPSAMLPAAKDEIEAMSHGEPSPFNIDEEKLTLELAERRSGISPPMQSYGSGSFNKRGTYSAMGTMSLLQEGNNRTDLSVSDVRYFHGKLGRILARQYAALGLSGDRFDQYGAAKERIIEGLKAILTKRMKIPIDAPTASVNREVEKQSDIMLSSIMTRHYNAVAQMLMQASNQQMPPHVQQYISDAVLAMNKFTQTILKHFGYDDPKLYAPEVPQLNAGAQGQPGQQAAGQPQPNVGGPGQPGGNPGAVQGQSSAAIPGVGSGSPAIQ